jgi:hypothetical protein
LTSNAHRRIATLAAVLLCAGGAWAQVSALTATVQTVASGGTIRGTVIAGTVGKPGVPLPGVSVTATNTLTGRKYTTATDIDGAYAMTIPKSGRYVIKAELSAFATATQEVVVPAGPPPMVNGQPIALAANFGLELASRAAAAEAASTQTTAATSLARGLQGLSLNAGGLDAADASVGGGNTGVTQPTLSGLGDSGDAVTVSGQTGQTNGLANFSEDELRSRVEDAIAQGRASGMIPQGGDTTNVVVNFIGGMMGGGGGGGRGGGGRGGGGNFRNFNPAQPHGAIFYQGGNSALNSAPWSPTLQPQTNPAAYSNRFGASIAGSPYIPGLTKPNTKQFVFLNLTGQKNLNAFLPNPVRVPTLLERAGDFSQSTQVINGVAQPVVLYDPATGALNTSKQVAVSPVAQNLLQYYPAPNIPVNAQGYNYQTISNAGSNAIAINSRYNRQLGQATATPFGNFGGGGGGGNRRSSNANAPLTLRQSINLSYNYSHSASDQRNIFLPLGGATQNDGNAVTAGYNASYGRLSNNASVNWNRNNAATRNYFTDTANNPSATAGLVIPTQSGGFTDPRFYNGLASISISNFAQLSNTTPSQTINQTISFSDFVSYRHKKHNMRFGFDIRRVHADSIGGNNPLGSFTFTGFATASAQNANSGSAFADFLLGLPQSTQIQAGLYKVYLRENVYDWYVQDDFRVTGNLTLNYGLRYEYFGPFSEKNNRLVNLTGISNSTPATGGIGCVTPNGISYVNAAGTVTCAAGGSASLVNPDHTMYAPRFGFAWKPKSALFNGKLTKDLVVRGGYGINYNTGQYAVFARSLSHQAPFSATQTNTVPTGTSTTATGCTTTTPSTTANLTLANGFGCSTLLSLQNNYAVDKNYKLGMVQVYNLNLQKTLPLGTVLNIGYNGSKAGNLDIVGSPNVGPNANGQIVTLTPGVAPFDYEESLGASHSNQLVISVQKRQQKGVALGATYTYQHAINNTPGQPVQDLYRLDLEEGNASFDQRHNLTGNWVIELPFGPNRAFFNKGGISAKLLDGYSLSGTFTFASGSYFTPQYSGNIAEASSGNTYTQRPDRVFTQSLKGPGTVGKFFNTAAFTKPAGAYGTASQGSIEGPGTVGVTASLSRTIPLGDTRNFEARVTATNVFNTVQYSGINTQLNSANFGQVTSAAQMRQLQVQARYRF